MAWATLLVVIVAGALWFATPLPTTAARYAWREWRMPSLAIALDREDAPLAMEIGNRYFGAVIFGTGAAHYDPALAARAFRRALLIQPGILWGHYSLARIAFAQGNFETAFEEINAELAANSENLRSLYVRGLIYGFRDAPGDLALAEADFRRFTTWTPTEWAGYNDLAWILAKERKYSDVKKVMELAFVHVPEGKQNPWLWNELGVARLALGERASARAAFEQASHYAATLTEADWRRAYSGNAPTSAQTGLGAFRAGIAKNLAKASHAP